jgi:hypothetical protein
MLRNEGGSKMVPIFDPDELVMLEDFIRLAKEGEDVRVSVKLRKLNIPAKVHPAHTEEGKSETESYLLIGDYTCSVREEVQKVPKVYMFGSADESLKAAKMHKNIANERLKRDYRRLKQAKIKVEEKYF